MKKIIAIITVLCLVFAVAGCTAGTPDEIVKEKKLTKLNIDSYVTIDCSFDAISTFSEAYDGVEERFIGEKQFWYTSTATVTAKCASANKVEFKDCVVKTEVSMGDFGKKDIELTLDENGNASVTFEAKTDKKVKAGWSAGSEMSKPVASFTTLNAEGTMKIHIKIDENGSVVTGTAAE